MKVIDGKDAVLGRLASYVAQEALRGEEIAILNCGQIKITGNKRFIQEDFEAKRGRVGTTQNGPKVSRTSEKIIKRVIRGMLPNYRTGRGRDAFKRIKCYNSIPQEFEDKKKIIPGRKKTKLSSKFILVKELAK